MAKSSIAKKSYVDTEGETSSHAGPNTIGLVFSFTDDTVITVNKDDIGPGCQIAAFWHGLAQKLGDTYAGKTLSEAVEAVETVLERLAVDDWVKAREGAGPRPSMVVDAIVAALEKAGQVVDEVRRAGIMDKVSSKENREAALANPEIKAHYDRIRAERAAEKAAKSAKAAGATEADLSNF